MKRLIYVFPITIILILSSGCSIFERKSAVIWTSRPEFSFYVEIFNARQDEYKLEIAYKEYPGRAIGQDQGIPDLVIGENLRSHSIIRHLDSLENIAKNKTVDADLFYPELYATCQYEGKPVLFPISFNLPALMFKEENVGDLDPFILSLESIMEKSKVLNSSNGESFRVMGFSPRWDAEVLYIKSLLLGTEYHETGTGQLSWNEQKLQETISFVRSWIETVNEGPEKEQEFMDKYLYDPSYKLVSSGRIGFAYTTLRDFFLIPSDKRRDTDIRWIARNDRIQVLEDILFVGIPKHAKNKRAAREFLRWFFLPENQIELMEATRDRRLRIFGIAEGLSSVMTVNDREFPRIYPALVGHIPPAGYLRFPPILPPEWKPIKEEVIKPWLLRESGRMEEPESLSRDLRLWLLQRPTSP